MIEVINILSLVLSSLFFLYFYVKSVSPASLERNIGSSAYEKCTRYRLISGIFMGICIINYVVYYFYPLPFMPQSFPWNWWISAVITLLILLPAGYLFLKGIKDAGEETMVVKKEHTLYGGIYTKIRHPQALGEITLWWIIALVLNSPFLFAFSFVWIPIFYVMCRAEERDLLIRYGEEYREYMERTGFLIPKRN
jgi:protein-S-isoprenylcysteine O-methyltransferase Ste14